MPPGPRCRRVLIVDDESLIRWALGETFRDQGCRVDEATDAGTARATLDRMREPPDLILLDIELPDSATLDFLSSVVLRAPAAKVVVMSANMTRDISCEALRRGACETLTKPFELSSVLRFVDAAAPDVH
jgi:DNA-binding NtrC family response regulator